MLFLSTKSWKTRDNAFSKTFYPKVGLYFRFSAHFSSLRLPITSVLRCYGGSGNRASVAVKRNRGFRLKSQWREMAVTRHPTVHCSHYEVHTRCGHAGLQKVEFQVVRNAEA